MTAVEQLTSLVIKARRNLIALTTQEQHLFALIDATRAATVILNNKIQTRIERKIASRIPGFLQRIARMIRDEQSIENELTVFLFQVQSDFEQIIRASHESAMRLGFSSSNKELRALGLPVSRELHTAETDYLRAVLADIQNNIHALRVQIQTAAHRISLLPKNQRVSLVREVMWPLLRNLTLRTTQGSAVVITRAVNDSRLEAYSQLNSTSDNTIMKTWTANFSNHAPCSACQELHGISVPLNHEFPREILAFHGMRVYRDLQGPSAHPNCLCVLIFSIVNSSGERVGIDPQGLRDFVANR